MQAVLNVKGIEAAIGADAANGKFVPQSCHEYSLTFGTKANPETTGSTLAPRTLQHAVFHRVACEPRRA